MANNTDSDQTAPKEQSDLGLRCLLEPTLKHFTIEPKKSQTSFCAIILAQYTVDSRYLDFGYLE